MYSTNDKAQGAEKGPVKTKQKQEEKRQKVADLSPQDIAFFNAELQWLSQVIKYRHIELKSGMDSVKLEEITPIPEAKGTSPYEIIVNKLATDHTGRILLATAMAASFKPQLFEVLRNSRNPKGDLPIIVGGQFDRSKSLFYPTFQTALFLLAGNDEAAWHEYAAALSQEHPLLEEQIIYQGQQQLHLETTYQHHLQAVIEIDESYYNYFLNGQKPRLDHGKYFPAQLHESKLTRKDIVLDEEVALTLEPISDYLTALKNGFYDLESHNFNKGFIAMFHGSPGTGKTLLAGILANEHGIDMYKVNLSEVVSKYIGETEKNLEALFNRLQGKNCMLFFDEADSLFGKRSEVNDAHDRFANQEVSYLLQRIEQFDGLCILATNFQNNLDEAFRRRIDVMVNMIRPKEEQRKMLWHQFMPKGLSFVNENLVEYLTNEYGYTGANIRNVIKQVARKAHNTGTTVITFTMLKPYLLIENRKTFGMNNSHIRDHAKYGNLNVAATEAQEDTGEQPWLTYLPEGYSYVNERLLDYLSKEFPSYTEVHIERVIKMTLNRLEKTGEKQITFNHMKQLLQLENTRSFGPYVLLGDTAAYGDLNQP